MSSVNWGSDTLRNVLWGLVKFVIECLNGIIDGVLLPASGLNFITTLTTTYKEVVIGMGKVGLMLLILIASYQYLKSLTGQNITEKVKKITIGACTAAIICGCYMYVLPWFSSKLAADGEIAVALAGVFSEGDIFDDKVIEQKKYGWQMCGWNSLNSGISSNLITGNDEVDSAKWGWCIDDIHHIISKTIGYTGEYNLEKKMEWMSDNQFAIDWLKKEHTFSLSTSTYNETIITMALRAANPSLSEEECSLIVTEVSNGIFNYNEKRGGDWWSGGTYVYQLAEIPTFIIGVIVIVFIIVIALQMTNRGVGLGWFFIAVPFAACSLCTEEKKAWKYTMGQIWLCFIMNVVQIFSVVFSFTFVQLFQNDNGLFNLVLILGALLFIMNVPQHISGLIGAQSAGLMGGMYNMMMVSNSMRMGASVVRGTLGGFMRMGGSAFNKFSAPKSGTKDNNSNSNDSTKDSQSNQSHGDAFGKKQSKNSTSGNNGSGSVSTGSSINPKSENNTKGNKMQNNGSSSSIGGGTVNKGTNSSIGSPGRTNTSGIHGNSSSSISNQKRSKRELYRGSSKSGKGDK